ncbi:MAG TPA: GspE/PulE family protein [Candidatus Saccharibacteria bacterium]|nr:type II/IV secretion system protein [Candidatus Saccharibacteria bacterium]MCB9817264.1 type II/IV secretion system protein [Candidatus Nomurabacteria bacterium]HPR10063.1 GspE/PulE family protein [Candidatus Saccharibacteria bacterium]
MQDENQARRLDEQTAQRQAHIVGVPYFDTSNVDIAIYKEAVSIEDIKKHKFVPLYVDANTMRFGITNTTPQAILQKLRQDHLDQRIEFYLISDSGYRDLLRKYDPPKQVIYDDINIGNTTNTEQVATISHTLGSVRADDMLAYVVKQAYQLHASDIHLETDRNEVRIRFRVDGVLHPIALLSIEKYRQLVSSLAVAANISTSSADAQTGHINKNYMLADGSNVEVNLRVETVPTVHGMDAVLRLFTLNTDLMQLHKLNLQPDELHIVKEVISHPNGLVLIVGPTGSGKTTTLYSILNELNSTERKLITLEDPVEYNIKGVTQIPVDSRQVKTGFAEKFRAVLRLDPDVVMVGEIRDNDTAKTALQSALTGHLVLSTYHAGSAAASLTRMLDAISENPLFASAIRVIMAQRLIRRLDDTTKQPYTPDASTIAWLKKIIDTLPTRIEKPNLDNVQLYKAVPSATSPFGYSGQFAVRELLLMTPTVEAELKKPIREITERSIQQVAIQDGMTTMLQEGVLRALAGETTIEEISRVLV